MLNEIIQVQKTIYYIIPFIWNAQKKIYGNRKQINNGLELGMGPVINCKGAWQIYLERMKGSKIGFWW